MASRRVHARRDHLVHERERRRRVWSLLSKPSAARRSFADAESVSSEAASLLRLFQDLSDSWWADFNSIPPQHVNCRCLAIGFVIPPSQDQE